MQCGVNKRSFSRPNRTVYPKSRRSWRVPGALTGSSVHAPRCRGHPLQFHSPHFYSDQPRHHFSKIAFTFLRCTVSAGLPPVRLSHDLNSTTLTRCSTCGCAARTVMVVIPSGISPAQTDSLIALSPRATASKSVSAPTHAICSIPSMSVTETRQDRLGTFGLYQKSSPFVPYTVNPLDHQSEDLYIILMPKSGHLKSGKAILLAALVLTTPALTFARGEGARVHKSNPVEWQKSTNKNHDMGSTSGGRVHKSNPVEWQESTNKNHDMGSTSGGRVHVETGPPSSGLDRTRAQDNSAFRK